jgi:hypothetical protein
MYKALIKIRKQTPALICGDFRPMPVGPGCLAFVRGGEAVKEPCLVVLNLSGSRRTVKIPAYIKIIRRILGPALQLTEGHFNTLSLAPYDILIAAIDRKKKYL